MTARIDFGWHLARMRVTGIVVLVVTLLVAAAAYTMPYRGSSVASPVTVALVAFAAGLWIGFSANRDAGARMKKIRRAYAVHGDEERLLRDHWLAYVAVLLRLEVMAVAGFVVSLWGTGPASGVWLLALCAIMIVLTWPTRRKTQLLLGRARAAREDVQG